MRRTTTSVQFYCRKSKVGKKTGGYAPLECSIIINGQRKFFNLPGLKFKPDEFNKKKPSPEIIEAMDIWRSKINGYQLDMMREGITITAQSLRETIQNGGIRFYTIGMMFAEYLEILQHRVGIDMTMGVYNKYRLVAEKALKFCHRDDEISKWTPALVQRITAQWRAVYDPATSCGYLTRLKTFTRFAIDNGHLKVNPFQGIKITKPNKPILALNETEVEVLLHRTYDKRLQRILDLFLTQCGTGMAYADLMTFNKDEHLHKEGDFYYISKRRVKTGREFNAIVLPWAVPIILHYPQIPQISNQKYNKALKEIDQRLTSHMGRRTYATILANKGSSMDINTIAAALGDDPATAMKYYTRIFTQSIIKRQIDILAH